MIIQTGLYSDKAFEILKRLEYHASRNYCYDIPVRRAPDKEAIIDHGNTWQVEYHKARRMYAANKFKDMISEKISDKNFDIDSDLIVTYKEISKPYSKDRYKSITCKVKDLMFIYSILAGQKRANKRANEFKDLIGIPNDPIQTSLEIQRRLKIDEIIKNYDKLISDLRQSTNKQINDLEDKLNKESERLIAQRDEMIANLRLTA